MHDPELGVRRKQIWMNHLIEFEEPMNKPTLKPLANQPMIYQLTHGNAEWRSTK
jgi:hypothetical protein